MRFTAIPALALAADQLQFAFELVRHGARSPFKPEYEDYFTVEPGMLTPSGMRQRYLLGRNTRKRYERLGLLSNEPVYGEIQV